MIDKNYRFIKITNTIEETRDKYLLKIFKEFIRSLTASATDFHTAHRADVKLVARQVQGFKPRGK